MKKLLIPSIFLVLLISFSFAQKPFNVVFYNLEIFFDTINDPEVLDDEFTPDGPKKWNTAKYNKKLNNTERVLFDIAAIDKNYPIVIGVSEVETRGVLEDIVATPKLAPANYRIAHFDSPEARGVDVAFLYRPDVFKIEGQYPVKTVIPSLPHFKTRDNLTMWGTIADAPFFFIVAHVHRSAGKHIRRTHQYRITHFLNEALHVFQTGKFLPSRLVDTELVEHG